MPFRDQKNIAFKTDSWSLVILLLSQTYLIFSFLDFNIFHIHEEVCAYGFGLHFDYYIHDVFPLYNAPEGESYSLQWYVFILCLKLTILINSYLRYYDMQALILAVQKIKADFDLYNRPLIITKYLMWVWFYHCVVHILTAGQAPNWWPWNNDLFNFLPMVVHFIVVPIFFYKYRSRNIEGIN